MKNVAFQLIVNNEPQTPLNIKLNEFAQAYSGKSFFANDKILHETNNAQVSSRHQVQENLPFSILCGIGGNLRISCQMYTSSTAGYAQLRIFKNSWDETAATVSTYETTTATEFSVDVDVIAGDRLFFGLYYRNDTGGTSGTGYLVANTLNMCGIIIPTYIFNDMPIKEGE